MIYTLTSSHPSAEFKSAVRSFESGLFADAASGLAKLLRRDPADADARYFLRLIERRLAPPPPPGPTTLIWQVDPAGMYESDWVRMLLSDCTQKEVIDTTRAAMAPRMVVVDNGLVEPKVAYYREAFERGCQIVLVHLSDESFSDDTGAYRYSNAVFRNYRSEVLAASARVRFFPLGYKVGFARGHRESRPASNRKFFWSFAGDAKKSTRRAMLAAMKALPRGFVHLTQGFGSADALSTDVYRDLLEDTLIVPCPSGWSNLESFRVYEALEAGCIPIVERRSGFDYFTDLLGTHPLPTVSDWAEVPRLFSDQKSDGLELLRVSCSSWWKGFKKRLRLWTKATVLEALT